MPEPMEFTITADDQPANDALGRVRSGLNQLERVAVDAGRRASAALDSLTRGVVKVAEAAGAIYVAKRAFGELRDSLGGTTNGFANNATAIDQLVLSARALRLAYSPTLFTGLSVGAGVLAESLVRLTLSEARVIEQQQRLSAELRISRTDMALLGGVAELSGAKIERLGSLTNSLSLTGASRAALRDFGIGLTDVAGRAKPVTDVLSGIATAFSETRDPATRAQLAITLFGENSAAALETLNEGFANSAERAREWGLALDGSARKNVLQLSDDVGALRRNFDDIGGSISAAAQKVRQELVVFTSQAYANIKQFFQEIDRRNERPSSTLRGAGFFSGNGPFKRTGDNLEEFLSAARGSLLARTPVGGPDLVQLPQQAETAISEDARRIIDAYRKSKDGIEAERDKLKAKVSGLRQELSEDAQLRARAKSQLNEFGIPERPALSASDRLFKESQIISTSTRAKVLDAELERIKAIKEASDDAERVEVATVKRREEAARTSRRDLAGEQARFVGSDPRFSQSEQSRQALEFEKRQRVEQLSSFIDEKTGEVRSCSLSRETMLNIEREFALKRQAIEREVAEKKLAIILEQGDREFRVREEIEDRVRQRRERALAESERISIDTIRARADFEVVQLGAQKDAQLRQIEGISTVTLQQKIAVEQRKAEIEAGFLERGTALQIAALRNRAENDIQAAQSGISDKAALDAIRYDREQRLQQRIGELQSTTGSQIAAARETAAIRSNQLIFDSQRQLFDNLKSGFESTFDSLISRTKSAGDVLKSILRAAFLTPVKEAAANLFANLALPFASALRGGGGGFFGRQGAPGGTGGFAGPVQSIPGLVGLGLGGGGQLVPFGGAPGGTSGFAGPVGGLFGGGQQGGIGGLLGLGGLGSKAGLSGAAGLGALGIGGAAFGLFGAAKLGQSQSGARYAAPALGAVSGLLGFGALTALFPSLVAAGPIGWAAAAGIGATVGIISLFRTSAEQKIVDKVREIYGVKIDRSFAKDPLAGIIHQQFGGDIAVGLRSPQVRDLINLYAMSHGESTSGIPNYAPIARSFNLGSGGQFTQLPSYQNGQPVSIDRLNGSAATNAGAAQVVVQLDGAATTAFLQGQAVQVIQDQPRLSQAAVIAAQRQNSGRRESLALQLQPGLLTA